MRLPHNQLPKQSPLQRLEVLAELVRNLPQERTPAAAKQSS